MLVAETVSIQLLNFVYWDDDINPLDDAVASPYVVLVEVIVMLPEASLETEVAPPPNNLIWLRYVLSSVTLMYGLVVAELAAVPDAPAYNLVV